MHHGTSDALLAALSAVRLVCVFRALPVVCFVLASREIGTMARCAIFSLYSLVVWASGYGDYIRLLWTAVGLTYFLLLGVAVFAFLPELRRFGRRWRVGLFCTINAFFLLAPGLALPRIAAATFLFIGWERSLAVYSYIVDEPSNGAGAGLREWLVFLLVDPTVVFGHRGQRAGAPSLKAGSIARIGLGAFVLYGAFAMASPVGNVLAGTAAWRLAWLQLWTGGAMRLVLEYMKHSGVASLQIGMLGCCGVLLPERYELPLLASSPAEFWRRWNMYIGEWVRRYVYFPIAVNLTRTNGGRWRRGMTGLGGLIAFSVIGLMHDAYMWIAQKTLSLQMTGFFLSNGILILAWAVFFGERRRVQGWQRLMSRMAFLASFVATVAIWM